MRKSLLHGGIRLVAVLVLISLLMAPVSALSASDLNCTGAIVIDADTGEELFSKNPDTLLVPASMTKIMAVYVVYEAIADGLFTEASTVPIDSAVSSFSKNTVYTNVPLYTTETYTVYELLDAVILSSACAATQALAKNVSGTEAAFVELMNSTAGELGLDCVFYDSYGGSSKNKITARSMAILCQQLIQRHPAFLTHSKKDSYTFHGKTYNNTNVFIRGTYTCDGTVDGIKTGFTTPAGYCFSTTAYNDYYRVIAVVMKATSASNRNEAAANLMNYGLSVLNARPAFVKPFRDVYQSQWYADAIGYVYDSGIMSGTSAITFEPETLLTRAMMAKILYNMEGAPAVADDGATFTDTVSGSWYFDAVEWAAGAGLVQGRGDGTFDPEASITRQEMVTMLYRYAAYKGYDTSLRADISLYFDVDSISDFAREAMEWSVASGLIQGAGDGTLNPLGEAQRSQIAQVLMNWNNAA